MTRQQPFASPEEALEHFGTKGMKWGVRKSKTPKAELRGLIPEPITVKTKNGDELTLSSDPPGLLHKVMNRSAKRRQQYNDSAYLTIRDKEGNDVGQGQMWKKGKDELYLNWIDIDRSQRGKGYASAVLLAAEQKGRELGIKKMTLEVPGISPDARHIYEKQGFKVVKEPSKRDRKDVWGGLTSMEKRLDD